MAEAANDQPPPHSDRPGAVAASARAEPERHRSAGIAVLTLGALGVVFGDIGTSPLYALQTVFHADHGSVPTSQSAVYGVFSLVFWSVTIIVSIKYVTLIVATTVTRCEPSLQWLRGTHSKPGSSQACATDSSDG